LPLSMIGSQQWSATAQTRIISTYGARSAVQSLSSRGRGRHQASLSNELRARISHSYAADANALCERLLCASDAVESCLSVTGAPSVGLIVTNSGADRVAQHNQAQDRPTSAAATLGEIAPKLEAPAFGLVVHYDGDMQRLIVEARDPVSGVVIFQVPRKYVTEQFATLPASVERVRGTGVDRAV
jgi:hypothetical protein